MTWRSIALPAATDDWAARPSVGAGVVAVGFSYPRARADGVVAVVAVYDIDGSPGFTIPFATNGRALETSEPAIGPDGVVRTLVYEQDLGWTCVAAHADGTRLPPVDLGDDGPLRGGDSSSRLKTAIAACAGGFVASYVYRGVRAHHLARYRDGDRTPVWTAAEWLLAATGDVVVGATPPNRGGGPPARITARAIADGRALWERPGELLDVAGATADAIVLVDRSARGAETQARIDRLDAAIRDGGVPAEDFARWSAFLDRWPDSPTAVQLVDAATGEPRWERTFADDVFAAWPLADGVAVMRRDATGRGELVVGARTVPLAAPPSSGWPPSEASLPAIVGIDGDTVVWVDEAWLRARRDLALPGRIAGFHPRGRDRGLTKANAAVGYGHAYARIGAALWIAEL